MDYRERGSRARGLYPTQGYLVHGNSKGEARGRSRHKNNSKIFKNMEERKVGTIGGEAPNNEYINIEHLEECQG